MRTCKVCGKEFSTGNSYRVHKSLKHRQSENQSIEGATTELNQQLILEPIEVKAEQSTSHPETENCTAREVEGRETRKNSESSNDDIWVWLAGGAAVITAIILALLGGKK